MVVVVVDNSNRKFVPRCGCGFNRISIIIIAIAATETGSKIRNRYKKSLQ